ncbi:hypothetical protein AMK06_CH01884 [Rhizobium sp. N541]|nr:hypothetical protein AMK05_CH01915 [Rhizobium sp. N324]ANM16791.1 hypothetical protein AMK06_CH01884 [Rhizobium sp. N541]ANM23176.1 hypothetical protein AMK07_CH01881 [Rhizobium sp. N941]OYD03947.1 hypothetical protein AMK08_CH101976 [Rhizobium sp. N4311]
MNLSISRHKESAAIFAYEETGRLAVRVNCSMGRFFSGNTRSRDTIGGNRLIAVVSLAAQGCSSRRSGLAAAPSGRSLLSFSARSNEQPGLAGDVDTGFVTFAVYEYGEGGKADAAPAERVPRRLQSGHAGSRVVLNDALRTRPSIEGQWAGCDAGKGAMELAAGSLASTKYIRGMHGASAAASCL